MADGDPGASPGGTIRNGVALAILIAVIAAPATALCLKLAGVEIPLWIDGSTALYLSGSAAISQPGMGVGELVAATAEGSTRDNVENVVLENVPFRAQSLIANAELQRDAIRASNLLFDWPAYPCFYGSDVYYLDEFQAARPIHRSDLVPGWERFADGLAGFAEAHPDVTFAVLLPAESTEPAGNPAIDLVSDAVTNEDLATTFERRLGDIANVRVVAQDFDDGADYYAGYFRFDHHWTAAGAAGAYNQLAEATGLVALEVQGVEPVGIGYMGSYARQGLIPDRDDATDVANDFSNLVFTDEDGVAHQGAVHEWYTALTPAQQLTDFYSSYFQGLQGTFTNDEAPLDESVLEVSDSFGDTFTRFVASSVSRVTNVDWLTQERSGDQSLAGLMESEDPSLVIFVGTPWNYASMCDRFPNLFA